MRKGDTSLGGIQKDFPKTTWAFVSQARDLAAPARRAGLEELCRRYWKPVYHYLRTAWARSNEDAKDLAQAFFLWLIEGDAVRQYAPERASFRRYLRLLLNHFVQDQDKAVQRLKRGGGVRVVPLDADLPPLKEMLEDPQAADPERAFQRAWRAELLARAFDRVRRRHSSGKLARRFRVFEEYDLCPVPDRPTYAALAERLGMSESDVHNSLFAVREEIRADVLAELSETTSNPEQLREEWDAFFNP
jgi:RNA polymerase sigma-70 factor (ECF subfamily)